MSTKVLPASKHITTTSFSISKLIKKILNQSSPVVKENPLLGEINALNREIAAIRSCFEMETDFDMIDFYILQLNALERRYAFLLKQAKAAGVTAY